MTATALQIGSDRPPRVYVVQEPMYKDRSGRLREKFSLKKAEEFGDICLVLNWSDPHELDARRMLWKARNALRDFRPTDYLLMVGNPTAMALVAVVAAEMADGCLQLLYWDNNPGHYRVDLVDFHAQPIG